MAPSSLLTCPAYQRKVSGMVKRRIVSPVGAASMITRSNSRSLACLLMCSRLTISSMPGKADSSSATTLLMPGPLIILDMNDCSVPQ